MGLDLINGAVRDNKKAGVLEPAVSKIKSLKFATEAAITILHIDDMIKLALEKREEGFYGDSVARGDMVKLAPEKGTERRKGAQFLTQLLGRV